MLRSLVRGRSGLKWKALPLVLIAYRLFGRRWTDFYAWMLDRQERGNNIDRILRKNTPDPDGRERGLYDIAAATKHIALLTKQGLKPDHVLLDFGCGFGRTAAHVVPYLNPGHYVGIDLSAERIRLAHDYMDRLQLNDRRPEFHVAPKDNNLAFLGLERFNYVFARAVFNHMPLADIRVCLNQLNKVMRPGAVMIADFGIRPQTEKTSVKDFFFAEADVRSAIETAGFDHENLIDWQDDVAPAKRRTDIWMFQLTKRR